MEGKAIYSQLAAIQEAIKPIAKNQTVNNQYKARGVDDLYNELSSIFCENKVLIMPKILDRTFENYKVIKNGKEGYTFKVYYTVEFTFLSLIDGSRESLSMAGEGADTQDKTTGKAMSNAYKYALAEAFMIPFEDVKDSDMYKNEPIESEKDYSQDIQKLEKCQSLEMLQAELKVLWKKYANDKTGQSKMKVQYDMSKELFQASL